MLKFRAARIMTFLLCVICISCASAQTEPSSCTSTITKYVVPGDSLTLTGPNPPVNSGATYSYFWTVKDPSGKTVNIESQTAQKITFAIPTSPEASYNASVLITDTRTGGCALKSCVRINVNRENTCSIIGTTDLASQICVTSTIQQTYKYTGTADLTVNRVAYLVWKVDDTVVAAKDTTGQISVVWSNSPFNTPGVHKVKAEVHSVRGDQLLSSCEFSVTVLPNPDTTITPA
jgi:hypothetical protein